MLLWVTFALAGPWEALGPVPPPARLVQEASGPDLVRAEIEEGNQHYWIDVTPDRGGDAFCRGGGYALQVRHSLDHPEESFELDPVPATVALACARLEAAAPALLRVMAGAGALEPTPADGDVSDRPGPDGTPIGPPVVTPTPEGGGWWAPGRRPLAIFSFRPFQLVVMAWGAVLAAALALAARRNPRTTMTALALFSAALVLRLRYAPLTTILGGDAAYERLTTALGRGGTDRYYGETWTSLFGLAHEAAARLGVPLARATDLVHHGNLLASAACAPLAWALARRAGLSRLAALTAGATMAALPHAVVLARCEDHTVLVGALQLLAGFAALGATPLDAGLAVLSATLLAHLRPDQLPTASVLLLPLLFRRRWFAFAAGALLIGARLGYLAPPEGSGPIQFSRIFDLRAWPMMLSAWVGAPALPLPGLYGLAGVGAVAAIYRDPPAGAAPAGPGRAVTGWFVLTLLATTLLYLPKDSPAADPLRFSLPAEGWVIVLAAAGAQALVQSARTRRGFLAFGLVLVAVTATRSFPHLPGLARPWAWESEYQFLREELPVAPPGDPAALSYEAGALRGWYDDAQDPNGAFARWLTVASGVVWMPWGSGTPAAGDLVYRGTADQLAHRWLGEACGLDPVAETEIVPTSDGWVDFGAEPLRFSLYRVRECGDAAPR